MPRAVTRPWALRPPDFFLICTKPFSGRVFVMSSYDAMVIYRVEGVNGLKDLTGIKSNNPSLFPESSSHHSQLLESVGYRFDSNTFVRKAGRNGARKIANAGEGAISF